MTENGKAKTEFEGLRVLLVEDDGQLSRMTADLLEDMGCAVVHAAASAEAAIDWVFAGGQLDMMITDIIMPGMNGIDLARHVRALRPETPVLLATGYGDALLVEQQRHYPVLSKPFRTADMSAAIGVAMGRA